MKFDPETKIASGLSRYKTLCLRHSGKQCFFACALLALAGQVNAQGAHAQAALPQAVSSTQAAPALPSANAHIVPFTPLPWHGGAIVRVRLNNTVDANFLLDTGAGATHITSRLVKSLGLTTKTADYIKSGASLPSSTPTEMVSLDRLRVGDIEITDVKSYVSDFTADYIKDQNVDGVLGGDFLKSSAVLFDFEKNNILLIPGGRLSNAQISSLGMTGGAGSGIPLKGFPGFPLMIAPVRIEMGEHKATLPLVIDTGALSTSVSDSRNDLKVKAGQPSAPRYRLGMSGLFIEYVLPVTTFSVGDKKQDEKRNNLAPFELGMTPNKKGELSLLGLDYLSHFRILIDYPARRLYLTPVSNPNNLPFPTESSRQCAQMALGDARLIPSADGKWGVVSTHKEGEIGRLGVQAGDVLETINGKKTDGLLLSSLILLFKTNIDVDDLQLRRDGKTIQVQLLRQKRP